MITRRSLLAGCSLSTLVRVPSAPAPADAYGQARAALAATRARLGARWRGSRDAPAFHAHCERVVAAGVLRLARFWVGTRWGLGSPQIDRPGGRVNCGTFVGRLLADAGFVLSVRALQQQASANIARTFAPPDRLRRFSGAAMAEFLDAVHEMGHGLFIIGLDYHVGLLVRPTTELRFVHASVETGTVVDERAASARLIHDSAYRVVGKALGHHNLRQWLLGEPIAIWTPRQPRLDGDAAPGRRERR
jgi:hypothetical protein